MSVLVPTVLADNEDTYKQQIERLYGFPSRVHIDIADGEFAPTFTISAAQVWWPQEWEIDIHAMVARPSEHVQALIDLKPNLIIFHAEVKEDLLPTIKLVQQAGIKAGVALLKTTVPQTVAPIIEAVDHVMIFSGDLGKYGGKASMMQLEKVRLVRAIRRDLEIGWDGGAAIENAYSLAHGGVDVINAGGAIQKAADPKAAYEAMVREMDKQGAI